MRLVKLHKLYLNAFAFPLKMIALYCKITAFPQKLSIRSSQVIFIYITLYAMHINLQNVFWGNHKSIDFCR